MTNNHHSTFMPHSSLVVFDLGRVLVRICDDVAHACRVAGVTAAVVGPLSAEQRAVVHQYVCAHETGAMDNDEYCRRNAAVFGIPPGDVRAMLDHYILGPCPGAVELVDELKARGVPTACLSNTNPAHWRLMYDPRSPAYFPLDRLDHQFASQVIKARKPDPAIYAFVERATGHDPREIVFFDDRPENVDAAVARGWQAHVVRDATDPIAEVRRYLRTASLL